MDEEYEEYSADEIPEEEVEGGEEEIDTETLKQELARLIIMGKPIPEELKDYFWSLNYEIAQTNINEKGIVVIMLHIDEMVYCFANLVKAKKSGNELMVKFWERHLNETNIRLASFIKASRSKGGFERKAQISQIVEQIRSEYRIKEPPKSFPFSFLGKK